jgi:hypothetical protein
MSDPTRNGNAADEPRSQDGRQEPLLSCLCSQDAASKLHVLGWLAAVQERELNLCRLLEFIADALPSPPDRKIVAAAIPGLRVTVLRHEVILRQILLPRLRDSRSIPSKHIDATMQRLSRDNAMDMLLANDAADLLEASIADHAGQPNAGMLGFVLRGFFEGRRRHIEWEKAVLIPLAENQLTPDRLMPLDDGEVALILAAGRRRDDGRDRH